MHSPSEFPTTPVAAAPGAPLWMGRILVVDDNGAVHDDFRKILARPAGIDELAAEAAELFGEPSLPEDGRGAFELDFAFQGREALARVVEALARERPYALAFVDVRMPPGWDGIETVLKLWAADADLQIVLCTAYSDYSWEAIHARLGNSERLLILKKPFEPVEVLQFAHALSEKRTLLQDLRAQKDGLARTVEHRTRELEAEIERHKATADRVREQATLLEKAREAIFVRDLEDTIVFWNQGAETMYGWSAAEVLGCKYASLLAGESDAPARAAALAAGSWNGDLTHTTKSGRLVQVECRLTLICDEAGAPRSILAINADVTEKKLIESQFLRAQRMEGIGSLASGIAHDLNNLLAPIIIGLDMIKFGLHERIDGRLIEAMALSAQRAADIVRQVLFFAKGVESTRTALSPARLLGEVEKIIRETFPKSIQIRALTPVEPWTIRGDCTQIHQVLLNLCVNARDAMPEGGSLLISLENIRIDEHYAAAIWGVEPGPHVVLEVTDTGTGIPPAILEKIFEPFFTTKAPGKGTGLGLSTVFAIAKNHGGAVTVRSDPGTGTTFRVYLPALALGTAQENEPVREMPGPGMGQLLLVVDDEPIYLSVLTRSMQNAGYRVITAGNGIEAVAMVGQHQGKIALALIDMIMPQLDGTTAIRVLRTLDPALRIVATSGGGTREIEEKARNAGADYFIAKPHTSMRLLQHIHEALMK